MELTANQYGEHRQLNLGMISNLVCYNLLSYQFAWPSPDNIILRNSL